MVKKPRRVRTFARTATKSMEKHLIENAKKLKENPFLVIPDYDDKDSEKHFKKHRKKIKKVHKYADDEKKLEKLSKKHDLSAAVAGTLQLAHSEKAPYLAVAKLPTGDITYAKRGSADKEKLIAVQHHDNPVLRILGIKDIVLKKNLHVYSWDKGFLSTGKKPSPPIDFIDFLFQKKVFSKKTDNMAFCNHLKNDIVKNKKKTDSNYLHVFWKPANFSFAICGKCARNNNENTLFDISKYMVSTEISEDFEVNVVGSVLKDETEKDYDTYFLKDYLSGKLKDHEFIVKNMERRMKDLHDSDEKIFVLNKKNYGQNMEDFIDALDPKKYERKALEFILEKVDQPVVFDDATPNTVLERFWDDYGLDFLKEITDVEAAEKFYKLRDPPSKIIETIFNYREQRDVLGSLPRYDSLPELAGFADHVARSYKAMGEKKAISESKRYPDNMKGRSVAFAFLKVFNKAKDEKWRFSDVEVESGEFLSEYAKKLLDSKGEGYHEALKELLVACGSSEKIDEKIK